MTMRLAGLLLAAASLVAAGSPAHGSPDAMEACAQLTDGGARLACFDREMQRRQATQGAGTTQAAPSAAETAAPAAAASHAASPVTHPAPPAAATTPAAPASAAPASDIGLPATHRRVKPAPVPTIEARVVELKPKAYGEQFFRLDNGQTWEQAESMPALDVRINDSISIKPGALGAFFLNTSRGQRVRVHRVL